MSLKHLKFRNFYGAGLIACLLLIPAVAGNAQSGAFAGYDGNWSGNGSITIADSGTERIRCRGTYTVSGGNALHQSLRCASDSYKFELVSDLTASGNQLSGSWSEATRGVNGSVSGTINGGEISALVQTNGYAANFSVVTRGSKQNVDISSKGEIRAVTISLTKG